MIFLHTHVYDVYIKYSYVWICATCVIVYCCAKDVFYFNCFLCAGSPDASMSTVLWAKTQQLQEDAFRQLQNIYGEEKVKRVEGQERGGGGKKENIQIVNVKVHFSKIFLVAFSVHTESMKSMSWTHFRLPCICAFINIKRLFFCNCH